jgi:hypothetical protein
MPLALDDDVVLREIKRPPARCRKRGAYLQRFARELGNAHRVACAAAPPP